MSTKVFKERWVNFIGDSKDGSGKFVYLSGDDQGDKAGFIIPDKLAKGVAKGAQITVQARQDGQNWKVGKLKVVKEAGAGGKGGGSRRGGGGGWNRKEDPARQQSIVMQHSQSAAIALLGDGAKLEDVLRTAVVLFSQAYGPGLEAAVAAAAELDPLEAADVAGDDFGDDDASFDDDEGDDSDDFDDDFDD